MFAGSIIRQRTKIHNLERQLQQEKESNAGLRNEVAERNLEVRRLKQFKDKITLIMLEKATIVDKHDKIKEVINSDQTNNNFNTHKYMNL